MFFLEKLGGFILDFQRFYFDFRFSKILLFIYVLDLKSYEFLIKVLLFHISCILLLESTELST